jgi:hypothetical protein
MRYITRGGAAFFAIVFSVLNPAIAQMDLSNPKAALKSLYTATQKADAEAIQKIMLVENDPQGEALKAYGDLIVAAKKLSDLAKQKYGAVPNAFAQPGILPEDAAKIDSSELTTTGNTATIKIMGKADPIMLQKVDGSWRVMLSQGADNAEHRTKRIELLRDMTEAMNKTSAEIAGDKFATVQEAETRVKERLGAALLRSMQTDPPTSGPATQEGARGEGRGAR